MVKAEEKLRGTSVLSVSDSDDWRLWPLTCWRQLFLHPQYIKAYGNLLGREGREVILNVTLYPIRFRNALARSFTQ
jgi:hypothetical protein